MWTVPQIVLNLVSGIAGNSRIFQCSISCRGSHLFGLCGAHLIGSAFQLQHLLFLNGKIYSCQALQQLRQFFQENPGIFRSIFLFSTGREQYIKMDRVSFFGTGKSIINIYFHGYFPEIINIKTACAVNGFFGYAGF